MSEIITRSLVDEINSSPVFSLMLDENTDITVERNYLFVFATSNWVHPSLGSCLIESLTMEKLTLLSNM